MNNSQFQKDLASLRQMSFLVTQASALESKLFKLLDVPFHPVPYLRRSAVYKKAVNRFHRRYKREETLLINLRVK